MPAKMADATMRLAGRTTSAIRSTCRPPAISDNRTAVAGNTIARTRRIPPLVVASGKVLCPRSRGVFFATFVCGAVRAQRGSACFLHEAQHQCDRQRRGGERNNDCGNDHRLRDRIARKSGGCGPSGYVAKYQKTAAAQQIERKYLSQRLGICDEPVQPEAYQR